MSDPIDLAAIRARVEAATPAPWEPYRNVHLWAGGNSLFRCEEDTCLMPGEAAPADVEFIAAARTDVPALLAEIDRLMEELRVVYGQREEAKSALMDIRSALARADYIFGWSTEQ